MASPSAPRTWTVPTNKAHTTGFKHGIYKQFDNLSDYRGFLKHMNWVSAIGTPSSRDFEILFWSQVRFFCVFLVSIGVSISPIFDQLSKPWLWAHCVPAITPVQVRPANQILIFLRNYNPFWWKLCLWTVTVFSPGNILGGHIWMIKLLLF